MKIFQGRRADFSWGHLSIDDVVPEGFGKAVWDANDQVVANPNLIVRITVEAVLRPIVPGSTWKSKRRGALRAVETIREYDEGGPDVFYGSPEGGGIHYGSDTHDWYHDNEWVSDPEPTP